MTLKQLVEIRGRWKPLGLCDKPVETYGKAGSAWQEGSALLTSSDALGLEWRLTNNKRKVLSRFKARTDSEQIVLVAENTRLRVKCNGNGFIIIANRCQNIEDVLRKVKGTLATVSKASSEVLSADDALHSLLHDESDDDKEMVIDDCSPPSTPPSVARRLNHNSDKKLFDGVRSRRSPPRFYSNGSQGISQPKAAVSFHGQEPRKSLKDLVAENALNNTPKTRALPVPVKSAERKLISSSPIELKSDSDDDNQLVAGFANLGNTCYMNVVWQCLLSLDTFTADLLHSCKKYEAKLEERSLLRCLSELAICKRKKQMTLKDQKLLLKRISEVVASKSKKYSNYRQHDAHEFFGDVIEWIKEETTLHSTKVEESSAAGKASDSQHAVNATVDNFEFQVETCLECTNCSHSSKRSETLNGLTVSIPETYLNSGSKSPHRIDTYIQHALDSYFKPEVIDYLCENCGANSFHSRQLIKKLPRILVLVARRHNSRRFSLKDHQKLYINKHIHLSGHCLDDTAPALPPTTDVKLWSPHSHGLSATKPKGISDDITPSIAPKQKESTSAVANRPSAKKKLVLSPPGSDLQSVVKVESLAVGKSHTFLSPNRPFAFKRPSILHNSVSSTDEQDNLAPPSLRTPAGKSNSNDDMEMALKLSKEEALAEENRQNSVDLKGLTEQEQLDLALAQSLSDIDGAVPTPSSPLSRSKFFSSPQRNPRRKSLMPINPNNFTSSGLKGGAASPPKLKRSGIFSGYVDLWSREKDEPKKGSCDTPAKSSHVKSEGRSGVPSNSSANRLRKRVLDQTKKVKDKQSKIGDHFGVSWRHQTGNKQSKPQCSTAKVEKSSSEEDVYYGQVECLPPTPTAPLTPEWVPEQQSVISNGLDSSPDLWDSDDSLLMDVDSNGDGEDTDEAEVVEATFSADSDIMQDENNYNSPNQPEHENGEYEVKQNRDSLQHDKENVEPEGNKTEDGVPSPAHNALPQMVLSLDEITDQYKHDKDGSHFGFSYKLMGVVSHIGSESTHGHYINDMYNIKDNLWLTYNDSRVTVTSVDDVCSNRVESGYMYFYMDSMVIQELKEAD